MMQSWRLLELVLLKTCNAWQGLDAEQKQLGKLLSEQARLGATQDGE